MIWTIKNIDDFLPAFTLAGEPDQAVIDAYLARTRHRQQPLKHEGVRRYYYLLHDDARVRLTCVGMPLDAWRGGAMVKVGVNEIIGEFPGNRHLIGQKGLQLQFTPIAWLREPADQAFVNGAQALEAISFQILDLNRIEQSQQQIQQKYQWKK